MWPTGQSYTVWVLVSWAKLVPPAAHKQSIHGFDQHSTPATHIRNTTLHDTQDTHVHTALLSTCSFALTYENMHNFTNHVHSREACISEVQRTECCHTVESDTADERSRESVNMQIEMTKRDKGYVHTLQGKVA